MTTDLDIDFTVADKDGKLTLTPQGNWTVRMLGEVERKLRALEPTNQQLYLNVADIDAIDTAGAYVLDRTLRNSGDLALQDAVEGTHSTALSLLNQVRNTCDVSRPTDDGRAPVQDWLSRIGQGTYNGVLEGIRTLSFVGESLSVCVGIILNPKRFRATATVAIMEEAGLDAVPIVMFLSFFVGMVIAFIGATTLAAFNSLEFTVELVGYAMLREFGVVLTAIILAGRTNSAFTAQIGAMKMRQEVDAMTVLGLNPMEVLVAPRIIAMLVMVPILTFLATVSGLFGGLIVCWLALDFSPTFFLNRLVETVPIENFWVGMSKAPFFAMVVALIGCRQGLGVGGSVQSLGNATTNSVVQALFSIIVIDAIFAMFFMQLGV